MTSKSGSKDKGSGARSRESLRHEHATGLLHAQMDILVRKLAKRGLSSRSRAAMINDLEALLYTSAKLRGNFNVAHQEYELIIARALGDRVREIDALRRACAVYRRLVRLFVVDLSQSKQVDIARSESSRCLLELDRAVNALESLAPELAKKERRLVRHMRVKYRIQAV